MIYYIIGTLVVLTLIFFIYMFKIANGIQLTREKVTFPVPVDEVKILFISDLHRRKLPHHVVKELAPVDYVFLGGDIAEKGVPINTLQYNLSLLSTLGKVYFVWGNNDYEFGEEKLKQILDEYQVIRLENESIDFNNGQISLVGVKDYGTLRADVEKAFAHANKDIILLSHNPDVVEVIDDKRNIVAILAGHTHGGQIRIGPFGIAELGGWKKQKNIDIFISNGFGTTSVPFRLGALPQIHLITIMSKNKHK